MTSPAPARPVPELDPRKFQNPDRTARGERRAAVRLERLHTLWFNTGTLCNLTCANCYIESSPTNDALVYLRADEVAGFLDQADERGDTEEIGFTGGEPFMNPAFMAMLEDALSRGYRALVLTNAMRPMMKCADRLLALRERFGEALAVRVSIDHHTQAMHELERGPRSWAPMLTGLRWLGENGFNLSIAGRGRWNEDEGRARAGYARMLAREGIALDCQDPARLVLFPEMDATADVPEITVDCWGILGVDPDAMMCASSRMVVRRKGAAAASIVACTLLPYDEEFDLGGDLAAAPDEVKLNHPHCARFCVLGGGACSVGSD